MFPIAKQLGHYLNLLSIKHLKSLCNEILEGHGLISSYPHLGNDTPSWILMSVFTNAQSLESYNIFNSGLAMHYLCNRRNTIKFPMSCIQIDSQSTMNVMDAILRVYYSRYLPISFLFFIPCFLSIYLQRLKTAISFIISINW